jgi:GAF domain-containing protein
MRSAWLSPPRPTLTCGSGLPLDDFRIQPEHEHGQLYVVRDLRGLSDPPALLQAFVAEGRRSLVSAPLVVRGQLIGALNLADDDQGLLEADRLEAVREVADSLSVALQDAHLLEQLDEQGQQLAHLSHQLVAVQESERRSIAHELHDEAGQGLTALLAGLGLLERQTASSPGAFPQIQYLKELTSGIMEERHRLAVHLRPVALGQVINGHRSLLVADTAAFPGWSHMRGFEAVRSWLGVPLLAGGKTIGLVSISQAKTGHLNGEHLHLAEGLAAQAAVAIQNA